MAKPFITSGIPLADSETVTIGEVDRVVKQLMSTFLKDIDSSGELTHGITLGLLVKCKKLYTSCTEAINNGDILAFSILFRSFYEAAITLRYILMYLNDDQTIRQFIVGDAMTRLYDLKGNLKRKEIDRPQYDQELEVLKRQLSQEGLTIEEIPNGYPKSWHPTKSYRQLAQMLDDTGEAAKIYEGLYGSMSILAHPSLADILRWHVTKLDDQSPFIPNENRMYMSDEGRVILLCSSLALLEVFAMGNTELSEYASQIVSLHGRLHRTFNRKEPPIVLYLESLRRYADFWTENYPSLRPKG